MLRVCGGRAMLGLVVSGIQEITQPCQHCEREGVKEWIGSRKITDGMVVKFRGKEWNGGRKVGMGCG